MPRHGRTLEALSKPPVQFQPVHLISRPTTGPTRTTVAQHLFAGGSSSSFVELVQGMTLQQANNLSTIFFIATTFPLFFGVYRFYQNESLPKGVFVGYAWGALAGLLAGPLEFLSQSLYSQSFFDTDWIHGAASGLFALACITSCVGFVLEAEQQQTQLQVVPSERTTTGQSTEATTTITQSQWPTALIAASALVAMCIVAVTVIAWANNNTYDGSTLISTTTTMSSHSPFLFGRLEIPPLGSSSSSSSSLTEPVNALSTASWISHGSEVVGNQQLAKLSKRRRNKQCHFLGKCQMVIQYGSIAVVTFHLWYNQVAPLLLLFAVLLCFGTTLQAKAANDLLLLFQEEVDEGKALLQFQNNDNNDSAATQRKDSFSSVGRFLFMVVANSLLVGVLAKSLSVFVISTTLVDPSNYPILSLITLLLGWAFATWDYQRGEAGGNENAAARRR